MEQLGFVSLLLKEFLKKLLSRSFVGANVLKKVSSFYENYRLYG